jgi:hypothetical protein
LREEREVAVYDKWTPTECLNRREKLVEWIKKNWNVKVDINIVEDEAYDETADDVEISDKD